MVAQEMLELLLGFGQKNVAAPVDDVNALAGVRVIKTRVMIL